LVLAVAAYFPTLNDGFVLDDYHWLAAARDNWIACIGLSRGEQTFYRPVSATIFGTIFHFVGSGPVPFHLFSVFCLAVTGWCLTAIFQTVFSAQPMWQGIFVGGLFILWGGHGEPICWVSAYPDAVQVMFGTLAIWLWIHYSLRPLWQLLLGATIATLVSIASKESAIPLVVIAPCFCWLARFNRHGRAFSWSWFGKAKAWTILLGPLDSIAAFWCLRRVLIGSWVGGYKTSSPFRNVFEHLFGERGFAHLVNLYFPAGREIVMRYGERPVYLIVGGLIVGAGAYFVTTWPLERKSGSEACDSESSWPGPLSLASALLGLCLVFVGFSPMAEFLTLFEVQLDWADPFCALAFLVALYFLAKRVWRTLNERIPFHRSWRILWLVGGLLGSLYIYNFRVLSPFDLGGFVFFTSCYFAGLRSVQLPDGKTTLRIGIIAAAVASLICIIHTLNLPISPDGQHARFSYFGSTFSVTAIGGFIFLLPKSKWQTALAALVATTSVLALYFGNEVWARNGRIAAATERMVGEAVLNNHRVYVLAAPGTIDGAGLFQIGIPDIPYAEFGSRTLRADLAFSVLNTQTGDLVEAKAVEATEFSIQTKPTEAYHIAGVNLMKVGSDDAFKGNAGHLKLVGYRPGDEVIAVDLDGPKRLR
jgi:hypothetical protein